MKTTSAKIRDRITTLEAVAGVTRDRIQNLAASLGDKTPRELVIDTALMHRLANEHRLYQHEIDTLEAVLLGISPLD